MLTFCCVQTFPGRTHALLQESGIDLAQVLKEKGFQVQHRISAVLASMLTSCCVQTVSGRTHALLQVAGIDLV